jgi:Transposase domain (DUF772)
VGDVQFVCAEEGRGIIMMGRVLIENVDYSILCRWFVGLNLDEPVWDATTFTTWIFQRAFQLGHRRPGGTRSQINFRW